MSTLKMAIISNSTPNTSYGGIGPFIKNLDPFLQSAYKVKYFTLPDNIQEIEFMPRRFLYLLYLLMKFKKLKNFDIILSHDPEGSVVASYTGVPFIHIFHGNPNPMGNSRFWYGKYFKWVFNLFFKRIRRKTTLLFTVGEESPGVPKILNPISHAVTVKDTSNRHGFIFSGRLEKVKNIDRIITIYSNLSQSIQRDHFLFIAGSGSQDIRLKSLVKKLGISKNVVFLGNLKNEEVIEVDSSKKILLMASVYGEGLPMAIAEALSVGVPVVTTSCGDISRIIKDNYNGFLLSPEADDVEYAKCIQYVLADYNRFSKNALTSSEIFKAEKVATSLISDINKTIMNNESANHS